MKPYQQVKHQTYLLNNYIGNSLTTSSYMTNNLGKYKLSNNTKFVNHHY
jgi:hypothetical protein